MSRENIMIKGMIKRKLKIAEERYKSSDKFASRVRRKLFFKIECYKDILSDIEMLTGEDVVS